MSGLQKIRNRRADLAQQRAALEKLDEELAIAERVLAEIEGDDPPAPLISSTAPVQPPTRATLAASRRERILEALSGEKVWMTSAEINKAIAKRHGTLIKGSSLYPMLSLLKKEGVIVRAGDNGQNIAIKRRAEGGPTVAN